MQAIPTCLFDAIQYLGDSFVVVFPSQTNTQKEFWSAPTQFSWLTLSMKLADLSG